MFGSIWSVPNRWVLVWSHTLKQRVRNPARCASVVLWFFSQTTVGSWGLCCVWFWTQFMELHFLVPPNPFSSDIGGKPFPCKRISNSIFGSDLKHTKCVVCYFFQKKRKYKFSSILISKIQPPPPCLFHTRMGQQASSTNNNNTENNNQEPAAPQDDTKTSSAELFHVNYADQRFVEAQKRSTQSAVDVGGFDYVWSLCREDLDAEFVNKNKTLLATPRGAGLWIWKPYVVHRALSDSRMKNNDFLFYSDSGSEWVCDRKPKQKKHTFHTPNTGGIRTTVHRCDGKDPIQCDVISIDGIQSDGTKLLQTLRQGSVVVHERCLPEQPSDPGIVSVAAQMQQFRGIRSRLVVQGTRSKIGLGRRSVVFDPPPWPVHPVLAGETPNGQTKIQTDHCDWSIAVWQWRTEQFLHECRCRVVVATNSQPHTKFEIIASFYKKKEKRQQEIVHPSNTRGPPDIQPIHASLQKKTHTVAMG